MSRLGSVTPALMLVAGGAVCALTWVDTSAVATIAVTVSVAVMLFLRFIDGYPLWTIYPLTCSEAGTPRSPGIRLLYQLQMRAFVSDASDFRMSLAMKLAAPRLHRWAQLRSVTMTRGTAGGTPPGAKSKPSRTCSV